MGRWSTGAGRAHDAATGVVVLLVVADPSGTRRRSVGWEGWLSSQQRVDGVMHRLAPPLFLSSIGAGALSAVLAAAAGDRRSGLLRGAAAVMTVAAVRVTLAVNDPVNVDLRRWQADVEPVGWRAERARWERGHRVRRVLLALAALATVLVRRRAA